MFERIHRQRDFLHGNEILQGIDEFVAYMWGMAKEFDNGFLS